MSRRNKRHFRGVLQLPLDGPGWYSTKYRSGGASYGSSLWAESPADARKVAQSRGMGETIESAPMRHPDFYLPSRLFYGNKPPLVVLHSLAFLCSIAASAGVQNGIDAMADTGLLHETLHYYLFGKDAPLRLANGKRFYSHKGRRNLYDWLKRLEGTTPGFVKKADR